MSHEATNWAIKQRGLKPAAKIVLWHLCDRYNPDHGCFPSQKTLAEDCEMSERSIRDQLATLEAAGLVRKEHRKSKAGTFSSDRYFLAFEAEFSQRQNLPAAKSASGKNASEPAANSRKNQRQNLPPNPVREPLIEPVKKIAFSEFWEKWPHKIGKDNAQKAWGKLSEANRELAISALPSWLPWWRRQNPDANHIHASTYLNQKRWQDETSPAPHVSASQTRIDKYNRIGRATQ